MDKLRAEICCENSKKALLLSGNNAFLEDAFDHHKKAEDNKDNTKWQCNNGYTKNNTDDRDNKSNTAG